MLRRQRTDTHHQWWLSKTAPPTRRLCVQIALCEVSKALLRRTYQEASNAGSLNPHLQLTRTCQLNEGGAKPGSYNSFDRDTIASSPCRTRVPLLIIRYIQNKIQIKPRKIAARAYFFPPSHRPNSRVRPQFEPPKRGHADCYVADPTGPPIPSWLLTARWSPSGFARTPQPSVRISPPIRVPL